MRKELIRLTRKEHDRLAIIRRLIRRELKQKVAAELLELTTIEKHDMIACGRPIRYTPLY